MRRLVGSGLRQLDLNLLGNQKCIVGIDAQVPHRTLDLGVAQQELDGPEIACSPIDQRSFGPSQECVP